MSAIRGMGTANYDLDNALRAIQAVLADPQEQWRFNTMD
jgi:hypothetical protein